MYRKPSVASPRRMTKMISCIFFEIMASGLSRFFMAFSRLKLLKNPDLINLFSCPFVLIYVREGHVDLDEKK
jgi:hypothetical protein